MGSESQGNNDISRYYNQIFWFYGLGRVWHTNPFREPDIVYNIPIGVKLPP